MCLMFTWALHYFIGQSWKEWICPVTLQYYHLCFSLTYACVCNKGKKWRWFFFVFHHPPVCHWQKSCEASVLFKQDTTPSFLLCHPKQSGKHPVQYSWFAYSIKMPHRDRGLLYTCIDCTCRYWQLLIVPCCVCVASLCVWVLRAKMNP